MLAGDAEKAAQQPSANRCARNNTGTYDTADVRTVSRCLIPRFDGAILSLEWKEAIWDRYVTGASQSRTPAEG